MNIPVLTVIVGLPAPFDGRFLIRNDVGGVASLVGTFEGGRGCRVEGAVCATGATL